MDESIVWVSILGVTFSGAVAPDAGLIWSDVEGWRGLPPARGDADLIPGAHGRFRRAKVFRESRVISFKGAIKCADNAELLAVCERLETELSEGMGPMIVSTAESGAWERWVEIDELKIEPDHGRDYTTFTIDMLAPDPRRYGPVQEIGPVYPPRSVGGVRLPQAFPWNFGTTSPESRLRLVNGGKITLFPTLVIGGGFASVTVVDVTSGRRLTLPMVASPESVLEIDCGGRRARLDGADVTRWMSRRQWFDVPKGEEHEYRIEVIDPSGSPNLRARFRLGAW